MSALAVPGMPVRPDCGELLTKRRPIDFGRVATCLCRPA
jgi:hypothetical protein